MLRGLVAGGSAGSILALGAGGWITFRLYVRRRVLEELEKQGYSVRMDLLQRAASLARIDLNMPPAAQFAQSIVPIWSIVMPADAIEDILARGRSSQYWPQKYRSGGALTDAGIEDALRKIAQQRWAQKKLQA